MSDLISINDAVRLGISRLRKPIWANLMDHLELTLFNGTLGPWARLYAPFNLECNGRDPVVILLLEREEREERAFVPYEGPLPESEEYKAEVQKYAGVLKGMEGEQ